MTSASKTAEYKLSAKLINSDLIAALVVAAFFSILVGIWFFFDHHFALQDEAEHIMNSMAFRDLLLKCRPWQMHWWHACLTVNQYYPPSAYAFCGFFMLCLGASRLTEVLCMLVYTFILSSTVYATTRLLRFGRCAAISSAAIVNLYPGVGLLNHTFLLDLPLLSMISLGLTSLLWWRSGPSWIRALITGILLSASCLTKQPAALFLAPVGAFFLISIWLENNEHQTNLTAQLLMIAFITSALCLPFIIVNYQYIMGNAHEKLAVITLAGRHSSFITSFTAYLSYLWPLMSPLWLVFFCYALVRLRFNEHWRLAPLMVSMLGGFSLLSLWPSDLPMARYSMYGLATPAVYSGIIVELLLTSGNTLKITCMCTLWLIAAAQYILCFFCPYPINISATDILKSGMLQTMGLTCGAPQKFEDWGITNTIKTIESVDPKRTACLNILINTSKLSPHAFELAVKEVNANNILPTGSRVWTLMGDKVDFSPKDALRCEWYLLEPQDPGYCFLNRQSYNNYIKLQNFIRISGRFYLVRQQILPDGNKLYLYRRADSPEPVSG